MRERKVCNLKVKKTLISLFSPLSFFLFLIMSPEKIFKSLPNQCVLLALHTRMELGESTDTDLAEACLANEGGCDHIIKSAKRAGC